MKTFYLCWIIALLMFLIIGISLIAIRTEPQRKTNPLDSNAVWFHSKEYDRIKRLHKFHGIGMSVYVDTGIYSSFVDGNGEEWFIRDGKKCKLWDPKERRTK